MLTWHGGGSITPSVTAVMTAPSIDAAERAMMVCGAMLRAVSIGTSMDAA
jgi:hypothetical protein